MSELLTAEGDDLLFRLSGKLSCFVKKWAILCLFAFIFVFSTNSDRLFNKSYPLMDSNPGPLVSETTALPTALQSLPKPAFICETIGPF